MHPCGILYTHQCLLSYWKPLWGSFISGASVFLLTVALFGCILMAVLLSYPWKLILHCPVFSLIHTVILRVQDNKRRATAAKTILPFSHASPGRHGALLGPFNNSDLQLLLRHKEALIGSSASLCGWWSVTISFSKSPFINLFQRLYWIVVNKRSHTV